MKQMINTTDYAFDVERYRDEADAISFAGNLGMDGFELLPCEGGRDDFFTERSVVGVHLRYFDSWLDFWNGKLEMLSKEYGSFEKVKEIFGGLDRSCILKRFREDLERARKLKARYVVFHVSDVSARELISDLKESLVNPEGDFVKIAPLDSRAHTVIVSQDELNKIKEGRNEMQQAEEPYPANQEPVNTGMPNPQNPQNMGNPQNMQGRGQQYANNGYQNPQNYAGGYYQPEEPQEPEVNPKLEKFMTIGSIVVGVLILAIFLALVGSATGLFDLGFLAGGSNKKQTETTTATETTQISGQVEVPSILGKTEAEAKEMLADTGLGLEYAGEEPSTDYDKGQIMAQQPAKGEMVDKNTTISYTVSTGSDKITLPDLENESADDAKAALEKLGLKCDQQEVYDISIAQGHVSYTSPGAGQEVAPNSTVTLYISNGGDGSVDSSDPASDTETDTDTETQETVKETKKETESKETSAKAEYSTDVKLYAPQDYNDEKVRIELVQDGKTTTLVDGEVVEFPYSLKMTSDSGSSATAYVYVLDDDGNILKKVEYEGVPFSK